MNIPGGDTIRQEKRRQKNITGLKFEQVEKVADSKLLKTIRLLYYILKS